MMDEKTKGILLRCARTYFMVKNWNKAKGEYEGLVAEFPNDPLLLEPLAIIYQNLGEIERAHDFARRAIAAFTAHGHADRAEKVAHHFGMQPPPTPGGS